MKALPWVLLSAAVLVLAATWRVGQSAVVRAQALEDSIAVLQPVVDSLVAEAERRDTVLVTVTDSVRVVVERTRERQTVIVDTLYAMADSVEDAYLDSLVATHAEEVAALERLAEERLLWGTSWMEAAKGLEAENLLLDARGDSWEAAYASRSRRAWYERGAVAVVVIGAVLLR